MIKDAILLLAMLVLAGCGAPSKPFQAVPPGPGQATIYVFRPSQSYYGSAVGLDVLCDKTKVGTVNAGGYVWKQVNVGHHLISSATERSVEIPFDAEDSRSYYIQADVEPGFWMGRPKLVMVPEEQGKLAILSTRYFGP